MQGESCLPTAVSFTCSWSFPVSSPDPHALQVQARSLTLRTGPPCPSPSEVSARCCAHLCSFPGLFPRTQPRVTSTSTFPLGSQTLLLGVREVQNCLQNVGRGGVAGSWKGSRQDCLGDQGPPAAHLLSVLSVHFQYFYIASLQFPSSGSSRRSTLSAFIFWNKLTRCFSEVLVSHLHPSLPVKESKVLIRAAWNGVQTAWCSFFSFKILYI